MTTKKVVKEVLKKKVSSGDIQVFFAKLVEPISVIRLKNPTTIGNFLSNRHISFDSSIRVNKNVVVGDYLLQNGDIITQLQNVSGGI